MPPPPVDPVTLEITRSRWQGIADQMCAALVRASYSPNIKDRRDCSAAIVLTSGEVLAQAQVGTPLHLGIMPAVVRSVLADFPVETFEPGDMVITNLPYPEGPGHLPDLSMVSVVHDNGDPVAIAATTAHHVDMGGYAPGSMPLGVTEIYQEGLQIPPTKIMQRGVINEPLMKIINQNVRTTVEVRGDLMAQVAAARIAEARVAEVLQRTDRAEAFRYMQAVLDHAERAMRAGIRELPDGDYSFEDFLDDDGISDEPVRIAVTLRVRGDRLTADFTGTSAQVLGPLNARLSAACACVYFACKAVIDPDLPTCAGAYRPIEVHAPEGTILNARYPAAIGNANILTDQRVVDVLLGAFHKAVPERVCAACSGEMNLVNVGGIDPVSGAYSNYVETFAGGQGACIDLDGEDGIHTHLTNTRNTPVEVIESTYPLEVVHYGLIPDSEGAGKHRGGCGMVRELRCLGERTIASLGADRRKFTPWGIDNEHHARGSHCIVTAPDGTQRELPTKAHVILHRGETLRIETPGAGGWGDPHEREPAAVAEDVAEGLVTVSRGQTVYAR